jgi:homogentisate 1,2-dioxygenase
MPYYRAIGEFPRKRHVRFRRPDGGLYAEELMGEEGFSSDSSLLYHRYLPTAIVKSEEVDGAADGATTPNQPLLPRHFRTGELPAGGDLVSGRQLLLANDDVRICFAAPRVGSGLYRNSTGDEAVYLRTGAARFESVYGAIDAAAGDYVVIPRGTIHRWIPAGGAGTSTVAASTGAASTGAASTGLARSGARMVALAERFGIQQGFGPTSSAARARRAAQDADGPAYAEAVSSYAGLDPEGLRAAARAALRERARVSG